MENRDIVRKRVTGKINVNNKNNNYLQGSLIVTFFIDGGKKYSIKHSLQLKLSELKIIHYAAQ
jgi:hypothetical protein